MVLFLLARSFPCERNVSQCNRDAVPNASCDPVLIISYQERGDSTAWGWVQNKHHENTGPGPYPRFTKPTVLCLDCGWKWMPTQRKNTQALIILVYIIVIILSQLPAAVYELADLDGVYKYLVTLKGFLSLRLFHLNVYRLLFSAAFCGKCYTAHINPSSCFRPDFYWLHLMPSVRVLENKMKGRFHWNST